MKAIYFHTAGAIALSFGLAACIPASQAPAPVPPQVVTPAPTPTPTPVVQQPRYDNWMDAPRTPGDWEYAQISAGSQALYNTRDPSTGFFISCIRAERRITLNRAAPPNRATTMTIRTETASRNLAARPGLAGSSLISVDLAPNDPLLDAMALSKGRFAVEVAGERTLYLPSWAEVTRVIEDCR